MYAVSLAFVDLDAAIGEQTANRVLDSVDAVAERLAILDQRKMLSHLLAGHMHALELPLVVGLVSAGLVAVRGTTRLPTLPCRDDLSVISTASFLARPVSTNTRPVRSDINQGHESPATPVGWAPCPQLDFTCIVFLYVPTPVRVKRLRLREQQRFGNRILNGGDMYNTHEEFIVWASRYDVGDIEGKTLARHEAYLKAQNCLVLEFRDVVAVSEVTEFVLQSLCGNGDAA